jgi:uncharacterized protein (DUF302 family)
MSYYFNKVLKTKDFDQAVERTIVELKKEGFGVLTEIDIKETFKKKLDVDFKKYKILGACNPEYAKKALLVEDKIGVFLPCNIVVEENENGEIEVTAVDPGASMRSVENAGLICILNDIGDKLLRVLANLE